MSLDRTKIQWFRRTMREWSRENFRDFPWRRTKDPYAILAAEFLLQKTDAPTAAPFYEQFIDRYPNLEELAAGSIEEITALLQPLGLHFRASRLQETATILVEQYKGKIPKIESKLLQLPGVGKYTARSVLANSYNKPCAVLDTNVARILERVFGLKGGGVKSRDPLLWRAAEQVAPKTKVGIWNLTLIDFGAAVCTAKNQNCSDCPLQRQCHYFESSL
ncbi:hypothetical protein [Spirulina sp. 06S082]|uniref:hypothetical protein n=1 Tax=Spirulina sp. 06S082 TaxID=3110248 RepID=UPI002B1E9556|nr:hypothetical protein [Spirulina sp. 06S082]MEA5471380.1 hypothetical protein [Spirulina sp. 06S082]